MHKPMVDALGVAPGSICHHLQVLQGPQDCDDGLIGWFVPLAGALHPCVGCSSMR